MLLENLLPVGAVAIAIAMFMVLIYYIFTAEPAKPAETNGQEGGPYPILDDDLLYLASSMYPYQEYVHFPVLPLNFERQQVTQPAQHALSFPTLSLPIERQEAIQPA